MKTCTFLRSAALLLAMLSGSSWNQARATILIYDSCVWLQPFLFKVNQDFRQLGQAYDEAAMPLNCRLYEVKHLLQSSFNSSAETGFPLLLEQLRIEADIKQMETEFELKKTKLRYRKGIEILKMLYEKILSMDHHFTSLKTQQEMLKISNPHNYPEFKETWDMIESKVQKKYGFTFPAVLQNNPYLSAAFSIIGLVVGGGVNKEQKADLNKIACIMDFTVRMHNDMNLIYYETGYLQEANMTLKRDCETLFAECTRQVGYTMTMESCRASDDWERLYVLLDNVVATSLSEENTSINAPMPDPKVLARTEINLQFAIDRMLQFINRYSDFVNQGNEYYKKFSKITANYENEKACSEVLPDQFRHLKADIEQTLEKFNSAYRMPEVQGSKLKDMLYGVNDN